MEPTPRASALAGPLRAALADLRAVIEPPEAFDPKVSGRTFRLCGGNYVGMTVLPTLMAKLADIAPRVDVRFRFIEKDGI